MTLVRHLEELADAVWGERHAGEWLLLALVGAELLATAGEQAFAGASGAELRQAVEEFEAAQLLRGLARQNVARDRGVPADQLTLSELAGSAPPPFDLVFGEHQRALTRLADDIGRAAGSVPGLPRLADDIVRGVGTVPGRPRLDRAVRCLLGLAGTPVLDRQAGGRLQGTAADPHSRAPHLTEDDELPEPTARLILGLLAGAVPGSLRTFVGDSDRPA